MTIPATPAKGKTLLQRIVARLFSIEIEDHERREREKQYAFIDGQRSIVIPNELRGLRAVELHMEDGRPFTVLVPHPGHAMLDNGTVYKITYAAQCPPNAKTSRTPSVIVPPGAVLFVAIKADGEDILNTALGIEGSA